MAENPTLAQPFSKNSRFFQSFTPNLKFSEGVEQLGKYNVKLAEKFAQTITCLRVTRVKFPGTFKKRFQGHFSLSSLFKGVMADFEENIFTLKNPPPCMGFKWNSPLGTKFQTKAPKNDHNKKTYLTNRPTSKIQGRMTANQET